MKGWSRKQIINCYKCRISHGCAPCSAKGHIFFILKDLSMSSKTWQTFRYRFLIWIQNWLYSTTSSTTRSLFFPVHPLRTSTIFLVISRNVDSTSTVGQFHRLHWYIEVLFPKPQPWMVKLSMNDPILWRKLWAKPRTTNQQTPMSWNIGDVYLLMKSKGNFDGNRFKRHLRGYQTWQD